jgi:hypothetical protein
MMKIVCGKGSAVAFVLANALLVSPTAIEVDALKLNMNIGTPIFGRVGTLDELAISVDQKILNTSSKGGYGYSKYSIQKIQRSVGRIVGSQILGLNDDEMWKIQHLMMWESRDLSELIKGLHQSTHLLIMSEKCTNRIVKDLMDWINDYRFTTTSELTQPERRSHLMWLIDQMVEDHNILHLFDIDEYISGWKDTPMLLDVSYTWMSKSIQEEKKRIFASMNV